MIGMQAAPLPFHLSSRKLTTTSLSSFSWEQGTSTVPSLLCRHPRSFWTILLALQLPCLGGRVSSISPITERVSSHQGATPDPMAPLPLPQPSAQMGWKEVGLCVISEPMPSKPWGCIYHSSGMEAVFRVWGAWQWSWSNLLNPLHQSLCNFSTKVYQPQVDPTMLGGKHASWQQSPKSSWENFSGRICLFVCLFPWQWFLLGWSDFSNYNVPCWFIQ